MDEIVYSPPANPLGVMHSCETLHDEAVEQLAFSLLKQKHPNTYTLTKAMAEWIVNENADNIPVAIVRPSIGKWITTKTLSRCYLVIFCNIYIQFFNGNILQL